MAQPTESDALLREVAAQDGAAYHKLRDGDQRRCIYCGMEAYPLLGRVAHHDTCLIVRIRTCLAALPADAHKEAA